MPAQEVALLSQVPVPVYQFGEFRLDCGAFELLRNGQRLRVERKPMELLILLASREGQLVTRAEIAQRLWSSEVFVDTEHGINTAIRKLRHLLRDDPENPQFINTVTGMGYRFIAPIVSVDGTSAIELGPATGPSPVPEFQPEERKTPVRPPKLQFWIALGAVATVLMAAYFLTIGSHPLAARLFHRDAEPPITSIAVLPLDNLSGDPSQEYFADGMTDELITMLAKNSTLRITSRTSVMQYKGARQPLPQIARSLGVEGILEGSISGSKDRVHLTLQLIRAETDTHLWAESYDRDASGVVNLPLEASQEIARHLLRYVSPASPLARTVNPAAHDAYLRGRYLWWSGQGARGFSDFRKAIELQPDYALGWAGLANYYGAGAMTGQLKPEEALGPLLDAATKAVALDDSQAETHLSLCAAIFLSKWDIQRADKECLRAIQLDPKFAEPYHFRARMLSALSRHDDAIQAQKMATEMDPTARPWAMPDTFLRARQFDAAIEDARNRIEAYPGDVHLLSVLCDAYRSKGMDKEAESTMERQFLVGGNPQFAAFLRSLYVKGGSKAVLRWRIRDLESRSTHEYIPPVSIAELYAQLGNREKTLLLLEDGFREHSPFLLTIQSDPAYDFLHSDPHYRSLIQRTGLPPEY